MQTSRTDLSDAASKVVSLANAAWPVSTLAGEPELPKRSAGRGQIKYCVTPWICTACAAGLGLWPHASLDTANPWSPLIAALCGRGVGCAGEGGRVAADCTGGVVIVG